MQKGSKGGKKGGGKAAWDDGYVSHSGQSESPSRQNQTQSASVRGLDEDALRLSQPNLALPWAVLGLASPPKMYSEQGSRKATLKWLVHWVSCRSGVSDWASGERNAWQRSLGGNRNERYERFRTGIASLEVFASQGDRVPLSFLPQRPGFLHVAKPFCICLAHRRPEPEGSFAALCPEALDAVKRMKGSTVDASSSTEYADKWKGLIETEAVASAVDEGLGRHLADTLVEWEHCSDGELLGKFQVKASLLFAHKIKFRSAMLHGEWASSWICLRYQGRGEWFGHGAVLRACFLEDDKDLLFAEEEEEWKDSTQNLQLTFRVIPGSSPHDPEDGLYTLELIPKALADSCMASALHELKACPLVQSLVLTGQPVPESISAPKVDLSVWGLNDSQLSAVTFALQNPFALVQGPPGTGKTMTTAVLATCFARQNMASGANRAVLLCTPTNRAADCAAAFVARICQKQAELRLHERSEVEGNVCAICLCSKPDMITLCSHAFHRQCLLQALDVGSFCPVCRQQVKHVDTGLRILRIYGADIEKQEFPVPKRNEHIGIDNRKPVQVPEDMRRFALHWRCHAAVEGEPASAAAERTRRAYSAMMKHGTGGPRFDHLRRNYQIALAEARAAELREADIVFTTCVSCRRMAVVQALAEEGAQVFWQVIVDEAGQATEPEALCPLTFAKSAKQICLFGDHQQLRPILKSQLTEGAGLAISLFERLVLQGNALQFLALQYRMNPGISWFPSHQFYGGRLLDDMFVQQQPTGLLEHPAQAGRSVPMLAWEVDAVGAASGERVSHTRTVDNSAGSRMHAGEAQSAARLAEQLAKIAGPASVGILCWYRAQVAAISEELCCPGIHVGSVATAQGSEWDYVLLSTVRRGGAAVKGRLGIVADPHILNVALTRARRGLVVLGHEATLSQDPNWKAFFDHCRQTDVQIRSPPLISTQPEILEESFARALVPGIKVEIQGLQSSPELNGKTGTIMTVANERGRWEVEVKKGSDARRLALKLANLSLVQVTKEPAEGSPESKSLSGLKAIVTSDRPVDGVEFSKTWQVPSERLRAKTKLASGEEVRIEGAAEGFEGALRSRGPDRLGCWTVEVSKHFCMQQGPVDVKVLKKGLEVSASGGMAHLLQQGKVVMLHGLKSQPKLNAEWGVVTSQAANEDGRWEVELVEFSPNVEARRLLLKPENLAPEV